MTVPPIQISGKIVETEMRLDARFGAQAIRRAQAVRKVLAAVSANAETDPYEVLPYWLFAVDTIIHAARKLSILAPGGKVLYRKSGPCDPLAMKRAIVAYLRRG